MFKNNSLSLLLLLLTLIIASSCSNFRKIQKSDDWKVKYDAAINYYENKDYYKTKILFEEILPIIKGTKEAEKAQFLYAYSHFYQKLYTESAFYFKSFYETYSRSENAEEAMYMHAYSLFSESPNHNLDQTSTYDAIAAIQNFINRYPNSKYVEQANNIIDQLQRKLEEKAYENAKLYYKINKSAINAADMYKAAIRSFENFQRDFPDSELNEEIIYLKIEAQYTLAKQSFKNLQKERYADVVETYQSFIDNFPTSKFLKDAESMYTNSLAQIVELQSSTK
jgi:outer membrane protein assembly factor BamD